MIYLDPQRTVDLLANALKDLEEAMHQGDKAVVLPNFPRCIQLDGWTCGARSVYVILRYYGKRCTVKSVEKALRTDWEGTDVDDIKKVLTKHGLVCQEKVRGRLCDLTNAIDNGCPVLISTHRSWHYQVIYGYSRNHIYVANSAILGDCGSVWCRAPRKQFIAEWDRWGIVVSSK
jgi:ABC-type bacteriocin/lantibiotic exporter with double-glycine peptidase domain